MTTLYSCRHAGDQYRITKFDNDMNVKTSYLCTYTECECPAGVRDTCRHRQMLPKFIARGAVNSAWLHDHDRNGWVQTDLGEALSGSVEFLDGMSQSVAHTYVYTTDEPPLPINHVQLNVPVGGLTAEDIEAMPDGLEKDYHREVQDAALATAGTATGRATGNTATFEDVAPAKPFRRGL